MTQKSELPEATLAFLRGTVDLLERTRKLESIEQIAKGNKITTSAVRKRIKLIRGHFGEHFFDRDPGRSEFLCPQAEAFIASANRILNDVDMLLHPTRFGFRKVSIATYPTVLSSFVGKELLPTLFPVAATEAVSAPQVEFPSAFPYYELEFRQVGSAEDGMREVELGIADCAIIDREEETPPHATHGFVRTHAFPCTERGFLYHDGNTRFGALASKAKQFKLSELANFTLFLSIGDRWTVQKKYLPDPAGGRATRVFVHSYAQVFQAVSANLGIGIGFLPKDPGRFPSIKFVGFSELEADSTRANRAIRYLQKRSKYTFDLYHSEELAEPRSDDAPASAAKAVVGAISEAAKDYVHDFLM